MHRYTLIVNRPGRELIRTKGGEEKKKNQQKKKKKPLPIVVILILRLGQ